MNCLNILLVHFLNILSEEVCLDVKKIFLLENNFWYGDREQLKTEKGYLYKVYVDIDRESDFDDGFHYYSKICYPLKTTNLGYVILRDSMVDDINSFLKSPRARKFLWKFNFTYTDQLIENLRYFKNNNNKIQEYLTYKLSEKISENCIKLRCDVSPEIRIKEMKKRFKDFVKMKLLKFNEYIKNIGEKKLIKKLNKTEDGANFDLYYFKNYSECFENLRKIIKDLCYFKLLKNEVFDLIIVESSISIDTTTTLKVSQFKNRLNQKFYENLKRLHSNEIDETWKPLFDRCCDYIKDEMLKNKIFLPIGDKFDIDYYINQLSNLIYNLVEKKRTNYTFAFPWFKSIIFSGMTKSLKCGLKKLQASTAKDLCESEYAPKHFSDFFGKQFKTLDDYIKIEKMDCDYYNMFIYIVNLHQKFNKKKKELYVPHPYVSPIFNDDYYNLRIIDGIKIDFKFPTKLGQIKGFDDEGKEIIIGKGTDYFVDDSGALYCPTEVLKKKNIQNLLVITFDGRLNCNKFKIKINDYLKI